MIAGTNIRISAFKAPNYGDRWLSLSHFGTKYQSTVENKLRLYAENMLEEARKKRIK